MLNDEQVQKIKLHLLEQLENFPEEQRKIIKHKILSMNNEEIEEFLKENNLQESQEEEKTPKCIFCSIVKKQIKSYIISEDKEYLAILELNPLSKGHTLIIPLEHYPTDKLPESSINFAKKIAAIIFSKLKPKDIKFQKNEVLGHGVLEIVPVYDSDKLEKYKASEEELIELSNLLKTEKTENNSEKEEGKKVEENKPRIATPKEEVKQEVKKPEPLPKIKPRLNWI